MLEKNKFLRKISAAVFILTAVLVFNGTVFCADTHLKLSLVLEKTEYSPDEPLNVVLNLKNAGSDPVWVNKRFYISSEKAPKNQKDVYFDLISPKGVKLACQHFYPTGYPKSDYFELLAPNKEVRSEYPRNLKGFFEIVEPGTYTITAVYQNVFGPEIGLDTFKEQLLSEPVKFTIVNAKK